MQVVVNEETKNLENKKTVRDFIRDLGYNDGDGIALAINDEVIPKAEWDDRTLKPNDNITLIQATQGG